MASDDGAFPGTHSPTSFPTRALLGLAIALLVTPTASSQDGDTPLKPVAHALLFQIGPDLDLKSFNGGTVSLKWHHSEASARRLGLTGALGAGATDTDEVDGNGDERSHVRNSQTGSVGASLLFLTHRRSRMPVYLYHGIGPSGGVAFNRVEDDTAIPGDAPSLGTMRTSLSASLGVAGALGVEWVVAPAISLTGEYSTSLVGTYSRTTVSDRVSESELASDRIGLDLQPGGARHGVSVYF